MNLRWQQKLATAFFVIGKVNSVMCAVTLFINIPLATVLLIVASVCIMAAIALCCLDMNAKPKTLLTYQELKDMMERDPLVKALVEDRVEAIMNANWPKLPGFIEKEIV